MTNEAEYLPPVAPGYSPPVAPRQAGVAVSAEKAVAEVRGMLMMAKQFPRDERGAYERIKTACQRRGLAESASYTYNRGGTDITGPSIRLAEAAAQLWGNLEWGWREVERGADYSVCEAYAWDTENNVRRKAEFNVPHYRDTRQGRRALKDDRDIYEVCANMASRRVRACLLNVIPGDVIEMAERECYNTLATNEEITPAKVKAMLDGLAGYGVTRPMVEAKLQRNLDAITPAQMVQLRRIFVGLRDGFGTVADYFTAPVVDQPAEETKAKGTEGTKARIAAKAKKVAPEPEPEPEPTKTPVDDLPGEKIDADDQALTDMDIERIEGLIPSA